MNPKDAERIAYIAHGAIGQTRADGKTPYIVHPRRVVELTNLFSVECELRPTQPQDHQDRVVAAYLHDVLEDTKLTRYDLLHLGITYRQLDIVKRLTKPDGGPAPASYYQGIAESADALVVKCADRAANLEDALAELLIEEPATPRRWARYVEKTYADVLPMYASLPRLRHQLTLRLEAIDAALPAAMERRAAVAERERREAGAAK